MKNKGLFLFLVRFLAVVTFSSPRFSNPALLRRHARSYSFSMDAGAFGCRLGPADAYRPEFRAARDQSGDARNAKNSLLARWDKRRKMPPR